jgi:hypothetical protein
MLMQVVAACNTSTWRAARLRRMQRPPPLRSCRPTASSSTLTSTAIFEHLSAAERSDIGKALATLSALTRLVLDGMAAASGRHSSLFLHLTGLRSLASLTACGCQLSRTIDADALIEQLTALTALTQLDLRGEWLAGPGGEL